MKIVNRIKVFFLFIFITSSIFSQNYRTVEKFFDNADRLSIDLVLSNCKILKSSNNQITVRVDYSYDDRDYETYIEQSGSKVIVEEEFFGNNPRGESRWEIKVPDNTEIRFNSGTGDLIADDIITIIDGNSGTGNLILSNVSGEFELNSGTGNLELKNSSGEFDLNSGTGNLELEGCTGEFDANSGTGYLKFKEVVIKERSKFNSGTGDVYLTLKSSPENDLEINSGTGDAVVNYNGNELMGSFYFTCNEGRGRIKCPVEFDQEEVVREGRQYKEKKFFKKGDGPRIKISTGTGDAELEL